MSEIFASPMFVLAGALLVIAALAFLLQPIFRRDPARRSFERRKRALLELRDELPPEDFRQRMTDIEGRIEQSRSPVVPATGLVAALLFGLPAGALALYLAVGTPQGIQAENGQTAELSTALATLAKTLKNEPLNLEAWTRWGMIQKQLQQFPAAEAAFRRVLYNDPDDINARVELAETLLFASGQPRLPDEGKALLHSVLSDDPDNQKALWLAGLGAFHDGDFSRAITFWTRLRDGLAEGGVKRQVQEQIQSARAALQRSLPADHPPVAGDSPETGVASAEGAAEGAVEATAPSAPAIEVAVELAPDLSDGVTGSETLFIFARAVSGPPLPLAIKRLRAADLPVTVTLTEADSMAEGMNLGRFPNVRIVARISRSGDAIPAPGDLQGEFGPVAVDDTQTVRIEIDSVVE